ncbi:MAG: glutamine amidotransferase [Verrucomicrobiota bacterium]
MSLAGSGLAGQTVAVELWQDGHLQSEKPVSFNEDEQTRSAAFAVSHDKPGTVQYEIRVNDPAADKEARSHPFLIEVMEPGNRVLYVQNALGFDFKFLRKAIAGDRNLKLSAFVRWADGRLAMLDSSGGQAEGAADFSPKALANCAVVILGDLAPDALSAENAAALRDFVDRGGGLVLLGGPNLFTSGDLAAGPLAAAIPVGLPAPYREGKFPVRITETGLHHPVFGPLFAQVKEFPPLLTCNVANTVAPASEVLMEAEEGGTSRPLVVGMRFGQGRTVAVLTDTLWRWRLAASGWSADRSPYDTFWSQLMDWLIPKEQDKQNGSRIELFTERTNYLLGERPEVRAIVRTPVSGAPLPATLPLRIRTPDDKVFDYVLKAATLQTPGGKPVNGYRAEVDPNMPGVFLAQSSATLDGTEASNETRFVVSRPPTEITGKPANRALLQQIAESTGGKFLAMEDWDAWSRDLHFKQQQFSRVRLEDLWNNPLLLGFLLLLIVAEWVIRKSWNLP